MLDSIRNHKRLLFGVLMLLILPSFVFFGVQGYDQMGANDDAVAQVDGRPIRQQEFDDALRRQMERLRQTLGGSVDPRLLDTPQLRQQVLDELIAQRVLAREAADQRITVTDAQLAQSIAATPGLRKDDGTFDIERYRTLLAAQNLNEAMFEAQMRRDLATQALPDAIAQSAITPKTVTRQLAAIAEQVRDVREQRFVPADFAGQAKPTPEQVKAYYERHAARFESPESARVEYVVLSADAISAQLSVPVDELRAYYEQNKAKYATAEERRASHILVRLDEGATAEQKQAARARAEQLLARVRAQPADFAAIAKAESQDPGSAAQGGDLGFFTRDAMVKPFADAAWNMKEGDTSGIVESSFGLHLIRLTGVKPPTQKSFDEVRPEIESEVRRQLAGRRFAEAAEAFSNLVEDQSDSLKPAADRFKLAIQSIDGVGRRGSAQLPADSPLNNPKVLAALFTDDALRDRRNTPAIDVASNTLVSARVVEHRPAQRKPFEAVEAEARQGVIAEESRKLALAAGQARLESLRKGGASGEGLSPAKPVSRVAPGGLPSAAVEAIFRVDTARLPAWTGVDLGEQGYAVYGVERVREASVDEATTTARRTQIAQQLDQVTAQQALTDYLESVKARTDVTRNADRIMTREAR